MLTHWVRTLRDAMAERGLPHGRDAIRDRFMRKRAGPRLYRPLGIDPVGASVVEVPECCTDNHRHGPSRSRTVPRLPASPYSQPRRAGARGSSVQNHRRLGSTDYAYALLDSDYNLSYTPPGTRQPGLQTLTLSPRLWQSSSKGTATSRLLLEAPMSSSPSAGS